MCEDSLSPSPVENLSSLVSEPGEGTSSEDDDRWLPVRISDEGHGNARHNSEKYLKRISRHFRNRAPIRGSI